MLQSLHTWDDAFLSEVQASTETLFLEKKAKDKFDPDTRRRDTIEELMKQVCAFANAGGGHLVYGIDKHGQLDDGVAGTIRSTPIKEWIEQQIPNLITPKLHTCQARLIQRAGHHQGGRGVLVVEVPPSDARPHWVMQDNREMAYIRAGEHSAPMSLQTFQDLLSRTSTGAVGEPVIEAALAGHEAKLKITYRIVPLIDLTRGGVCKDWVLELRYNPELSHMDLPERVTATGNVQIFDSEGLTIIRSTDRFPLFPGRKNRVTVDPIRFILKPPNDPKQFLMAHLFIGTARPVEKTIHLGSWPSSA